MVTVLALRLVLERVWAFIVKWWQWLALGAFALFIITCAPRRRQPGPGLADADAAVKELEALKGIETEEARRKHQAEVYEAVVEAQVSERALITDLESTQDLVEDEAALNAYLHEVGKRQR